jgi:O-acetyl-ADP-ribose deacetylase (regulator of RNase III)
MLSYVAGNLFESPAQTLVNTVNTGGVMGKGLALEFKRIYPKMFEAYQRLCETREFRIGSLFLWRTPNKLVLNFPTKADWRKPSRPEYIEAGLAKFVEMYAASGITSVAFPPLGCGNGELDFGTQVRPLMEKYLADLPIPVFIYAPLEDRKAPEHRDVEAIRKWLRTEPKALPFSEMWRDLIEVVERQREFQTLRGDTNFEVEYVQDEDRLRVRTGSTTRAFKREEIQELWQELRDHGIVTKRGLAERERDLSYLMPVLLALPYIDAIELADSYDKLNFNSSWALQLVPVSESGTAKQRELALNS